MELDKETRQLIDDMLARREAEAHAFFQRMLDQAIQQTQDSPVGEPGEHWDLSS